MASSLARSRTETRPPAPRGLTKATYVGIVELGEVQIARPLARREEYEVPAHVLASLSNLAIPPVTRPALSSAGRRSVLSQPLGQSLAQDHSLRRGTPDFDGGHDVYET